MIGLGTVEMIESADGEGKTYGYMATGALFGELPFLDDMNRQFTVRCTEPTKMYEISFKKLTKLLDSDNKIAADFYRSLAHFLSTRLRKVSNEMILLKGLKKH